jgi:putative tricarboxylic transport membrane protein
MKASDLLIGAILVLIGLLVSAYGYVLPPMVGQRFGAGLFPMLIGLSLIGFGAILAFQDVEQRRLQPAPLLEMADWFRDPKLFGNMALIVAVVVLYIFFSTDIGFILSSFGILLALFLRLGVPLKAGVIVSIATTAFIQLSFVDALRVPLPRGILDRILW